MHDSFEVRRLWAALEVNSTHRMLETYGHAIEHPELAEAYGRGLVILLRFAGYREQARITCSYRLQNARASGDLHWLQEALGDMADVSQGTLALELLEERERICRASGDQHGLQEALGGQVLTRWMLSVVDADPSGDEKTEAILAEQHRICRRTNDRHGLQKWMETHAFLVHVERPVQIAMRILRNRERLCRELGELDGLWESLLQLSLFLLEVEDYEYARTCALECEEICRELGSRPGLCSALGRLEWLSIVAGDVDRALAIDVEERQLGEDLGFGSQLEWHVSRMCQLGHRPAPLPDVCERAKHVARQLGDDHALQEALGWSARLHLDHDPPRTVAECAEREAICSKLNYVFGLRQALQTRGQALLKLDRAIEALAAYIKLEQVVRVDEDDQERLSYLLDDALSGQQQALERLLYHCGSLEAALSIFAEQERLARELRDQKRIRRARLNRERVRRSLGQLAPGSSQTDSGQLSFGW